MLCCWCCVVAAGCFGLPQKGSCLEGKWDPGYFTKIRVGERLFHLARWMDLVWWVFAPVNGFLVEKTNIGNSNLCLFFWGLFFYHGIHHHQTHHLGNVFDFFQYVQKAKSSSSLGWWRIGNSWGFAGDEPPMLMCQQQFLPLTGSHVSRIPA